MKNIKWFHAIGVCGKTTSNIALMFKKMGWFVTGSDSQFFPPASTFLEKQNIPVVEGYHFTHLNRDFWEDNQVVKDIYSEEITQVRNHPDLCLIVESATSKNKEYLYAKTLGVDVRPYAEILSEYFIRPNSIVVVGSAGKTTTTALVTTILINLGLDPSYMIGAEVLDFELSLVKNNSRWSVIEGDEYYNKDLSKGAKFLQYSPKYLIITSLGWEHQDIYPSKEIYLEEFRKAVRMVPADGAVLAPAEVSEIDKVLSEFSDKRIIRYKNTDAPKTGIWCVVENKKIFSVFDPNGILCLTFTTSLLGKYNIENICGAVALAFNSAEILEQSGISIDELKLKLVESIQNFKGPKKRLEILFKSENTIVIDDFAVAPERIINTIKTLKSEFPEFQIVTVFEPNSGSRPADSVTFKQMYKSAFLNTLRVIIPSLSNVDTSIASTDAFVTGLNSLGYNALHVDNSEIKNYLQADRQSSTEKYIYLFCSAYRLSEVAESVAMSFKSKQ